MSRPSSQPAQPPPRQVLVLDGADAGLQTPAVGDSLDPLEILLRAAEKDNAFSAGGGGDDGDDQLCMPTAAPAAAAAAGDGAAPQLCLCCRATKYNAACVNKLCRACCEKLTDFCTVSAHNNARYNQRIKPFLPAIQTAIDGRTRLWIRYNGGTHPGTVRPIEPLRWLQQNRGKFLARCVNSEEEKTYLIGRITGLDTKPFE